MKYLPYFLIALGVILIDQALKLYIHSTLSLGEDILIFGDWFKLHYTLNPGMAFGIELGSDYGKLILTIFRIFAGIGIAYVMARAALRDAPKGFVLSMALILGGAFGNIVDSTFYGVFIEGNAVPFYGNEPHFYPWFHGQVIDMFYFDIASGYFPENIPFVGGDHYSFFPIFNVADAAIFIGVCIILIWQKRFFPKEEVEIEVEKALEDGIKSENDLNENTISEDTIQTNFDKDELDKHNDIDSISDDNNLKEGSKKEE
ncbi:lipoprotein signal peptidase [Bernardetia litoralis DSM 6794]|uniref:Lipoprotein signal peptidase n=1 Tax=Bernardetia litoralis (strain ATCC 23117 / DSM 6794 / NBRC 15988 / NCIMB 1366 / Fx l1 / Sio-4) TaxID=880071 RepID=I4AML4_BERLS|nr:lipoprotein signal peptidase [Bernardetia litoralis]AFM05199.1 lipoprotein signal peptidase [Bernardetia litoralis DSM 6794]